MKVAKTIVAVAMFWAAPAMAADSVIGTWVMSSGKVTVRVSPCGPNLCGTLVGLKKPLNKYGKPKTDHENPDPALRSRPVIGIQILNNMKPTGPNSWAGTIYNADDGRTYTSKMSLDGNAMRVKGCVLFICKAMSFVRAN
jgi:uncharacterized protein (DUF2147 family)